MSCYLPIIMSDWGQNLIEYHFKLSLVQPSIIEIIQMFKIEVYPYRYIILSTHPL